MKVYAHLHEHVHTYTYTTCAWHGPNGVTCEHIRGAIVVGRADDSGQEHHRGSRQGTGRQGLDGAGRQGREGSGGDLEGEGKVAGK